MTTARPFFNTSSDFARQAGEQLLKELQRSQADISAAKLLNLLGTNVDYTVISDRGETPLLLAAQKGFSQAARNMVDFGADVNAADHFGFTPLMMAASGGDIALTDKLLENGAKLDARSAADDTAFALAAGQDQQFMLKHLLAKGLIIDPAEGEKLYDAARNRGHEGTAKIIREEIDRQFSLADHAAREAERARREEISGIASQFTQGTGAQIQAPRTARFSR
ncbi:MAG TPA: ankyrin repeat domain-containing protein [Patescibacteria group bacterium]|nr:ankyrin repeat domain-containing protein [Patescibacteria group bacterium]